MKIYARAIKTEYWKPGDKYLQIIVDSVSREIENGDIVAVSEKALAVAQGRIVDESKATPSIFARSLTVFWMRFAWGYFLGTLCHMRDENMARLRSYPVPEGARHKQICLERSGLFQTLLPFSEGGIDTTNLPYSFASLPLESPTPIALQIQAAIRTELHRGVGVVIVDSDKTYSSHGIHLASRATEIGGMVNLGFFAYLIGRVFRWKARSTPIAWAGPNLSSDDLLRLAGLANKARGHGAGRTTWEMAARFGVDLTNVTWEMLEQVEHKPIVILRSQKMKASSHQGLYPSRSSAANAHAVRSAVVPGLKL